MLTKHASNTNRIGSQPCQNMKNGAWKTARLSITFRIPNFRQSLKNQTQVTISSLIRVHLLTGLENCHPTDSLANKLRIPFGELSVV